MPLHARTAEAEAVVIADASRAFAFGSTAIYHQITQVHLYRADTRSGVLHCLKLARTENITIEQRTNSTTKRLQGNYRHCEGALNAIRHRAKSLAAILIYPEAQNRDILLRSNSYLDETRMSWSPQTSQEYKARTKGQNLTDHMLQHHDESL